VVTARARWVSVSMIRPARITLPRLTRAVIQPYRPVPTRPDRHRAHHWPPSVSPSCR
jgi:hypothetical protein